MLDNINKIRSFIRRWELSVLCAALLAVAACSNYGEADSATVGVVKSVDIAATELVVVTPEGIELPIQVEEGTEVRVLAGEDPSSDQAAETPSEQQPSGSPEQQSEIDEVPRRQGNDDALADSDVSTQSIPPGGWLGGIEALQGREGKDVVVLFNTDGGNRRAVVVEDLGHNTLRTIQGRLVSVDRGTGKAVVHGSGGIEEAFDLVSESICVTEEGIADIAELLEKGEQGVTVYYTAQRGRKIARLIRADDFVEEARRQ